VVDGVRVCAYQPGVSVPAAMPAEVLAFQTPAPFPLPTPPANTATEPDTLARHLRIYDEFGDTIETEYVYPDFRGLDWPAARARYRALIEGGLTDDDFYLALNLLLAEIGDDHSRVVSPDRAAEEQARFAGNNDYVGIGASVRLVAEAGHAVIIYTFPSGSAYEAGLRGHDTILAVDGVSVVDHDVSLSSILRGAEGTTVTLTVRRPGEAAYDLTLTRRRITGSAPVDFCLLPGTRVAYLFLPGLNDSTIPDQVRSALALLTANGPLDGLILDNRQNGGGANTVLAAILGFFTHGTHGYFVSRAETRSLDIEREEIGNSQTMPLVVLVDVDTASYGEVLSGVLQAVGRATVMGQTTLGNVETMWAYDFEDGSRAWIAREAFQFPGQAVGLWEETGIVPDVLVPTRWDLFTEANDPALAAALPLLQAAP
jgi:carboxyl-terminal processing protease